MNEPYSLFVIINNAAARARRAWPGIKAHLEAERIRFDAHESVRPGETEERTRAALRQGFGTVAVVGGDGTLSAAASGYFEPLDEIASGERPRAVNPEAALAILPAGTGDDFARGLAGGRRDTLDAWLKRLVAHCREPLASTRSIDVLSGSSDGGARRFLCLNAATIGIGAEVAGRVAAQGARMRRLPGEARFAWAALHALATQRRVPTRVSLDGEIRVECGMNLVAIANGQFAGGGMNFAPGASTEDGLLDVVTVCRLSRAGLLRELARIHRGGHLANPKVKLARGTYVTIETLNPADSLAIEADGDVRGRTPAEFRVLPAALRVACLRAR